MCGSIPAIADRLVVELTETAALHHFEENAQFVSQLREMGCRVAIDDFGAGYTSFRNLQMLHIDTVKIDGSYVEGLSSSPENQIFVRTLVDLAKSFKLKTTAEWVAPRKTPSCWRASAWTTSKVFISASPCSSRNGIRFSISAAG